MEEHDGDGAEQQGAQGRRQPVHPLPSQEGEQDQAQGEPIDWIQQLGTRQEVPVEQMKEGYLERQIERVG